MSKAATIRVLVADDHVIVRLGLATLVNRQRDMQVVGQASTGADAVELYRRHHPDVTLMDLRMPGHGGVEAITAICADDPGARVIVLTIHKGDEAVYQALRAGARGYLLKDAPGQEIVAAVRTVHGGERCIPPEIADRLAERLAHRDPSPREVQVLRELANGASNKELAGRLGVSVGTIKNQVASVLDKLGAHDRTHAVALALERGILDLDEVGPSTRR
ncbi:MAG TPA: response regulator transcription factor, partial [Vicinamibacteria bacterium]